MVKKQPKKTKSSKVVKKAVSRKKVASKKKITGGNKPTSRKKTGKNKKQVKKKKVSFTLAVEKGNQVYVAGSFNNWDPDATPLKFTKKGVFTAKVDLPPGKHEYKFVVNGQWLMDHQNPEQAPNSMGSHNSVLYIKG